MIKARFRDRLFTPMTAQSMLSPQTMLLAGVPAAIVLAVGAPLFAIPAAAAAGWAGSVGFSIFRQSPERLMMETLPEGWRQYLVDAKEARERFIETTKDAKKGPLKSRLENVSIRIDDAVHETYKVARRGAQIEKSLERMESRTLIEREMRNLGRNTRSFRPAKPKTLSQEEQARYDLLQQRLDTVTRMENTLTEIKSRLRLQEDNLQNAVYQAVELSAYADTGTDTLDMFQGAVDSVLEELENLRVGMEDIHQPDEIEKEIQRAVDNQQHRKSQPTKTAQAATS